MPSIEYFQDSIPLSINCITYTIAIKWKWRAILKNVFWEKLLKNNSLKQTELHFR